MEKKKDNEMEAGVEGVYIGVTRFLKIFFNFCYLET